MWQAGQAARPPSERSAKWRHHSSTRCEKCAAAFSLRIRVDAVETSLATFANIADHLDFPWLAETVAFLRGQGFSQAPEIF